MSADAVSSWLEQHGGPRRFSTGDSGDSHALKQYLASKGYDLSLSGGVRTTYSLKAIGAPGRGKGMSRDDLMRLVDKFRAKDGLPAIKVAA